MLSCIGDNSGTIDGNGLLPFTSMISLFKKLSLSIADCQSLPEGTTLFLTTYASRDEHSP
jgi:hypothetical protein